MSDLRYWLYFLVAFMAVLAVLTTGVAVSEWWEWRRSSRK